MILLQVSHKIANETCIGGTGMDFQRADIIFKKTKRGLELKYVIKSKKLFCTRFCDSVLPSADGCGLERNMMITLQSFTYISLCEFARFADRCDPLSNKILLSCFNCIKGWYILIGHCEHLRHQALLIRECCLLYADGV